MIVFDLKCGKGHVFETWFKDGKTFDRQAKAGKVCCPVCGNSKVEKAPMAPAVTRGKTAEGAGANTGQMMKALRKLRSEIEKNSDYVGPKFAEEARKIHYGEVDRRNIYGEATTEEAKSLKEEGVDVHPIPWVPRGDS